MSRSQLDFEDVPKVTSHSDLPREQSVLSPFSPQPPSQAGGFGSGADLARKSTTDTIPARLSPDDGDDSMRKNNPPSPLQPMVAQALASSQILTATQSWSSWFADKLSFSARVFNVFFYASVVTTVFALFAIQRGNGNAAWAATYAITSALFNYPMAIAFNETLFAEFFQGLGKKPLSAKVTFGLGLMLAIETTIAGLAVAEDAVNGIAKDLPSSMHFLMYYAIFTFCLNTFATRMVGAAGFLHGIYTDFSNFYYRYFTDKGVYFDLKDDLDRYAKQVESRMILGVGSAEMYSREFYKALHDQKISPNRTCMEHIKSATYILSVNLPGVIAFFLLPMWIGLSQSGWKSANALFRTTGLDEMNGLVYSSAVSSWLFYIRASRMFADNAIRFHAGFSERAAQVANWVFSSECLKTGATYLALAAGWGAFVFSSGCSGSGFAAVIHDDLHPANGTFPINSTNPYPGFGTSTDGLFKIVPFEWLFKTMIAPMGGYAALATAGVAINGGSLLKFIADCWDIQKKEDCSFLRAVLIKMLSMKGRPDVTPQDVAAEEEPRTPLADQDAREDVGDLQRQHTIPAIAIPANHFLAFHAEVKKAVESRTFPSELPSPDGLESSRRLWAEKTHCGLFTRLVTNKAPASSDLTQPLVLNDSMVTTRPA